MLQFVESSLTTSQKTKAQLTQIDEKGEKGEPAFSVANINIKDTQGIQVLQDQCQQLATALDLNCETILGIEKHLASLALDSGPKDWTDTDLPALSGQLRFQMKRVDHLLQRLDGTIALVSL